MTEAPTIHWDEGGRVQEAHWRLENGAAPAHLLPVYDDLKADAAYGLACQGTALLWRGDFHNGRQLLTALGTRADRRSRTRRTPALTPAEPAAAFNRYRQLRAQRARTLNALVIELDADYAVALPRAPNVRQACLEAYGPADTPCLVSLRGLLGLIGAHEWRRRGMEIAAVGGRIHPHYGVFAPVRSEYVDLVSAAPLPAALADLNVAFDIGTGTGVLSAVLARRGVQRVIATDIEPRALACARENIDGLGFTGRIELQAADLFPAGRASLVVCNPPWLPARPSSALERGIYDAEGAMLAGFLAALPSHLAPGGEGWLILSDLAEHLGLRTRDALLQAFEHAGLTVLERHDINARHPKSHDSRDPLHDARAAEVTSLWRLGVLA